MNTPIDVFAEIGERSNTLTRKTERILNMKPTVIILCIGANDLLNGTKPEDFSMNLASIVKGFSQDGVEVIFLDFLREDYFKEKFHVEPTRLNAYRQVINNINFPGFTIAKPNFVKIFKKPGLMQDSLHPSANGNALLAKEIFDSLPPSIRNLTR